jgi:hypothetical protein
VSWAELGESWAGAAAVDERLWWAMRAASSREWPRLLLVLGVGAFATSVDPGESIPNTPVHGWAMNPFAPPQ